MTFDNTNILKVYEVLLDTNQINGPADFCKKIKYHQVSWCKIQSGERAFPDKKFADMEKAFGVRVEFLRHGEMPIFKKGKQVKKEIVVSELSIKANEISYIDENGLKTVLIFRVA